MKHSTSLFAASVVALAAFALPAAHAQTVVNGTYTGANGASSSFVGGAGGDGYDAAGGVFDVTGGTYTGGAGGSGGFAGGSGGSGLSAQNATVVISSGAFSGGSSQSASIFGAPGSGVLASTGSVVEIDGGTFAAGSGTGFLGVPGTAIAANNGTITLFGVFSNPNGVQPAGTGTIVGTLEDNTVASSITYSTNGTGSIILNPSAAPEPSSFAALGVGIFSIGGLVVGKRRRAVA